MKRTSLFRLLASLLFGILILTVAHGCRNKDEEAPAPDPRAGSFYANFDFIEVPYGDLIQHPGCLVPTYKSDSCPIIRNYTDLLDFEFHHSRRCGSFSVVRDSFDFDRYDYAIINAQPGISQASDWDRHYFLNDEGEITLTYTLYWNLPEAPSVLTNHLFVMAVSKALAVRNVSIQTDVIHDN